MLILKIGLIFTQNLTHKTAYTTVIMEAKLSKLSTSVLIKKYQEGQFSGEELQKVEALLIKRGQGEVVTSRVDSVPPKKEAEKKKQEKKKIYTDPKSGKKMTKSDFVRSLIHTNREIKSKEINERLKEVGFGQVYFSEIDRCRKYFDVITETQKIRREKKQ